jgi:hypothetical protein
MYGILVRLEDWGWLERRRRAGTSSRRTGRATRGPWTPPKLAAARQEGGVRDMTTPTLRLLDWAGTRDRELVWSRRSSQRNSGQTQLDPDML